MITTVCVLFLLSLKEVGGLAEGKEGREVSYCYRVLASAGT